MGLTGRRCTSIPEREFPRRFLPPAHPAAARPTRPLRLGARGPGPARYPTVPPVQICHLAKYYPPARGGIESHVQTLARLQAAAKMRVQVIAIEHRDGGVPGLRWEDDQGVQVARVTPRLRLNHAQWSPEMNAWLRHEMTADIVHLHLPNPSMQIAWLLARPAGALIVTHHSDIIRQRWLHIPLAPLERATLARAASILASSPNYIRHSPLLRRFAGKTMVLPLGAQLAPFLQPNAAARAWSQRLRAEQGEPLWLFVGRLVYYKGLDTAIRALAHCPGKLLIIGTGPLEARLRRLARRSGVETRVIWAGQVEEDFLAGAYAAATAFWFPSHARSEGFGLVQIEAMASGCPLINAGIAGSGVNWVSPHEESGLTVPAKDPGALAAAALRLWQDGELRRQLGAGGRERAQREFTQEIMAQRVLQCYWQALAEKEKRPAAGDPS